jgi:hypothetical protein
MHSYGDTRIVDGNLVHRKGPSCAAIPRRDWEVPVSSIHIVAELTTPGGPIFDYYYLFLVGEPPKLYRIPMESLEPVGLLQFHSDLECALGGQLYHSLGNSATYACSIMWPQAMAGKPLIAFSYELRKGFLNRLLRRTKVEWCLSDEIAQSLDPLGVEWAC